MPLSPIGSSPIRLTSLAMYSTALALPAVASRRPCIESSAKMYNLVFRSAAVIAAVVAVGAWVRPRRRTSQFAAAPTSGEVWARWADAALATTKLAASMMNLVGMDFIKVVKVWYGLRPDET